MAKYQVGSGIDSYIKDLQNLEKTVPDAIGAAVYKGAGIITDEVRKNISQISSSKITELQRQGLKDGLGISRMKNEDGYFNVKVGFAGYNQHKTEKYPQGHPNSMIARTIESGTSWLKKEPFVSKAVRAKKADAEEAMAEVINDEIDKKMRG